MYIIYTYFCCSFSIFDNISPSFFSKIFRVRAKTKVGSGNLKHIYNFSGSETGWGEIFKENVNFNSNKCVILINHLYSCINV